MTVFDSKRTYDSERDGALSILLFVNEEGGFLNDGLQRVLSARTWTPEQRRLLTRLAKGTLERQIEVDAQISAVSSRPLKKIKPVILNILRMSVYSLDYLSGMPAHAVCNEAVRLAKKHGLAGLGGFVNGILRRISADGSFDTGDADAWDTKAEIKYSVPRWIIRRWIRDYGHETTERMLEGLYEERPLTARVNRSQITADALLGVWREAGILCGKGTIGTGSGEYVTFEPAGAIEEMPGYSEGWWYIQDVGSITAGAAVPVPGSSGAGVVSDSKEKTTDSTYAVLDLCAAPGGKATQVAERLLAAGQSDASDVAEAGRNAAGFVLACDQNERKSALIRENAERLRLPNVRIRVNDATVFNPEWQQAWDVVIADVPCSGLGVIGRKPDIKLRLRESDIESLVPVQRAILENAVRYAKDGGYILYATCTADRAENDDNVQWVLDNHPELELCPLDSPQSERGAVQLLPGIDLSDGFYIALMRKCIPEK